MGIGIIIVCLLLSAFFTGMEVAFISSNKIYLELEKKQEGFISMILTKLTDNPSRFMATMFIGNAVALVVGVFFMAKLLFNYLLFLQISEVSIVVVQILIMAAIVLLTSKFLPRVFFQIYANTLIKFFALPAYGFYLLFYYVSSFFILISDVILKLGFKEKGDSVSLYFSKAELGNYITEQMSTVEDDEEMDSEIQIFQKALDFSGVRARDVLTPRTEIIGIDVSDSMESLKELFVETGYSKIVVYRKSIDNIVGYVHFFDLFKKAESIKEIMIPVQFVSEFIYIKDAMSLLMKKRKSVAVVLDEYGGTSGIITMEDIVEELFGEIEDEHDLDEELIEEEEKEGVYLFSARLGVKYLNQTYKLQIPESDAYETLGGFIVSCVEEIPQKGGEIIYENYHFSIEETTNKKIELIKMQVKD